MEELRKEPLPAGEDGRRAWSKPQVTKAEISVVTEASLLPQVYRGYDGGGYPAFYNS